MPCAQYIPKDGGLVYLITDYRNETRPGWRAGEILTWPCWLFKREKELRTNTHWTLSYEVGTHVSSLNTDDTPKRELSLAPFYR